MTYNFYAGPAILPQPVLSKAAEAIHSFKDMDLSILEISHRTSQFQEVMDNAENLVRDLLGVPEEYAVLFLTGGASSQFYFTAMNLLGKNDKAGYIDTGTWSTKAIKEAALFGNIEVIASSKDQNYSYIPKGFEIPQGLKYIHLTSNNTISGTQFQKIPEYDVPLVCDMSSDIFSKPIDIKKYDLIYAGAQKNLGPAGVTLVIVKKEILGKVDRDVPTMLDYRTHIKKGSMFNTPPAFPIFVSMLTMEWIKENGGVSAMEIRNEDKAALLYGEIDRNSCFKGTVSTEDRSRMNVTFLPTDESYTDLFIRMASDANCVGIKGHRSVGGFRASTYNSMDIKGVTALVEVMKAFEINHGK